jgi:hypothetical protein
MKLLYAGGRGSTKDEHGQWHVEPAELHRVYPAVAEQRCESEETPRDAMARAALAEQRLTELKAMLEDMRAERDAWR